MKKKIILITLWCFSAFLLSAVIMSAVALFLSVLFTLLLKSVLDGVSEGNFAIAALGMLIGFILSPLSLIFSYKLSLHLAKLMEEKWGLRIDNPKKLFWLAVLVPVGVLFLAGAIF